MRKIIIITICVLFFLTAVNVQASFVDKLPELNIMPDNPFYFLRVWYEKIITFISFGDAKKAERYNELAQKRLQQAEEMAKKGKEKITNKLLKEYEKLLDKALKKADQLKKRAEEKVKEKIKQEAKKKLDQVVEKVSESTLKNQEILLRVYELVPEDAREAIKKVIEITKMGYERAVDSVSGIKKEELMQKAEDIKIRAQELINGWQKIFK